MDETDVTKVMEMIGSAGLARSRYLEAVRAARESDFERTRMLTEDGEACFEKAHEIHAEFLASRCENLLDCNGAEVNLILVHAEDQMMCAETFRVLGMELIELYKMHLSGVYGSRVSD